MVSLNSNCGIVSCDAGSAQETWLRADLAAHPARCTAALWHHPLLSSVTDSSGHHDEPRVAPLWKALREAGAELVLNGHAHTYERFAPMTEAGVPSAAGLRELVVGTGGARHHPIFPQGVYATSQKRDSTHFGLLRLRLDPAGYSWAFVDEGGVARDSGNASCR